MAQDGMPARGQDVTVRFTVNGTQNRVKATVLDVSHGLAVETVQYIGGRRPSPYGTSTESSMTVRFQANSNRHARLIAEQFKANDPNSESIPLDIDVNYAIDYGPGGREVWVWKDCILSAATTGIEGNQRRNENSFVLTCEEPTFVP